MSKWASLNTKWTLDVVPVKNTPHMAYGLPRRTERASAVASASEGGFFKWLTKFSHLKVYFLRFQIHYVRACAVYDFRWNVAICVFFKRCFVFVCLCVNHSHRHVRHTHYTKQVHMYQRTQLYSVTHSACTQLNSLTNSARNQLRSHHQINTHTHTHTHTHVHSHAPMHACNTYAHTHTHTHNMVN